MKTPNGGNNIVDGGGGDDQVVYFGKTENDFEIQNANGIFTIRDIDANADRLTINSTGRFAINGLTSPPGIFNINTGSKVAITKEENKSDSLINLGKYIVGTI